MTITYSHRRPSPQLRAECLLTVEDLVITFSAAGGQRVQAVSGVSFDVAPGETLGLVGESGCGKSTTGRAIMAMLAPNAGRITFDGIDLTALAPSAMRALRPRLQMIFQDPISSLNPRRSVADIIAEPLAIWGKHLGLTNRRDRVAAMMEAVGLDYDHHGGRHPSEFSGGQCQRISIARALMLDPTLLICDEPVSALDVSVQAQILNLLEEMKTRYGLTMVFIGHDLAVVHNVADRVAVMYLGRLAEIADATTLFRAPAHHYTAALLAAVPEIDKADARTVAEIVVGEPPSAIDPPSGCRFRTRCPAANDVCSTTEPPMRAIGEDHYVACHHPLPTTPRDVATGH